MSCLLTAISSVNVAPIYNAPESTPPQATATGKFFAGSSISSPITEANSRPTRPNPIKTPAATKVPMAPKLLIHFPTPRPTILSTVKKISSSREAHSAKILLSASAACPGPSTNTETPTKYNMTVGTYIMLFVQ